MYQNVTSLKLGRDLTINGTARSAGYTLTASDVTSLGTTINSLVAKRWVIPNPDPSARRLPEGKPQPTYLNPTLLKALKTS
jgi:hypothetical protein